jgi:hypothetical protein
MVRPDMWRDAVGMGAEEELGSVEDEAGSREDDGAEEEEEKSTLLTLSVRVKRTRWDSVEPV